ncbi:hypothetical protein [Luteibacter sp.]|uniref:hypothetical protein n=1 Tax=Luteibacter sp. TaxID=1886636 RepID=UPI003F7E8017
MDEELNIAGKDWLTEVEAAHYCGVSVRQFQGHYSALGLSPRRFMGRKLYGRAELYAAIERSPLWDGTEHAAVVKTGAVLTHLPNLTGTRMRPYKPRKKAAD